MKVLSTPIAVELVTNEPERLAAATHLPTSHRRRPHPNS
jgi:hypothetical protein